MEAEIKEQFEKAGFFLFEEEEILRKCLAFCINYKLSPSDLLSSWEIHSLNRQLDGVPTIKNEHMDGFLSHIQNEQRDVVIKEETNLHLYSSDDVDMILNEQLAENEMGSFDSPARKYERSNSEAFNSTPATNEGPSTSSGNRMTPFGQRTNKFVLQTAFNGPNKDTSMKREENGNAENDFIRRVPPSEKCDLQVHQSRPEQGCRFMCDRIEDKFNSLEARIRRHASALVESGLHGELFDASLASQKSVFVAGMICCEGEGRLNENSILLQGSVENSGGQRVRLDLHKLDRFSLFPGQIVGIEGRNPSGHCLIVSKLVDSLPLLVSPYCGLPPAKKQVMRQKAQPMASNSAVELSMIIAAGPFTTTDNLLFEPLVELLAYACRKQPQLLLLLGPFIDSEHPDVKKGTVARSFDEIFHEEVLSRLQDYVRYMGSGANVLLVPSTRDAHHDFVFPQAAFDVILSEDLKHQIIFMANPGVFSANEVMVGCCSVDILKQLSSEEISRIPADGSLSDRMGRLATHILKQRSFYPLYPPSVGVPLDFSLASDTMWINSILNVLVLPSDLAPFVKVLPIGSEDTGSPATEQLSFLCVNPGRLSKGIGGGTFVELNCRRRDPHRSNAQIIRI